MPRIPAGGDRQKMKQVSNKKVISALEKNEVEKEDEGWGLQFK